MEVNLKLISRGATSSVFQIDDETVLKVKSLSQTRTSTEIEREIHTIENAAMYHLTVPLIRHTILEHEAHYVLPRLHRTAWEILTQINQRTKEHYDPVLRTLLLEVHSKDTRLYASFMEQYQALFSMADLQLLYQRLMRFTEKGKGLIHCVMFTDMTHEHIRKRHVLRQIVTLVQRANSIGIFHNDVHLENIMYRPDAFYLIDFEKASHVPTTMDLRQLRSSLVRLVQLHETLVYLLEEFQTFVR